MCSTTLHAPPVRKSDRMISTSDFNWTFAPWLTTCNVDTWGDTSTTLRNPRERLTPWYSCTRRGYPGTPVYCSIHSSTAYLQPLRIFEYIVFVRMCAFYVRYRYCIFEQFEKTIVVSQLLSRQLRSLSSAGSIHTDSGLFGILVFEVSVRHTAPTNRLSASGKLLVYYRTLLNVAQQDTNRCQDAASRLLIRPS